MRKHILLITLFYLFSLVFAAVSNAEYNSSDSDYEEAQATAFDGIEWSANISSCKIRFIPFPQQKVDIAALNDYEFQAYLQGDTKIDISGISVEFYGSNGSWCKAGEWPTEYGKVIIKQNNQVYAQFNGKLSSNGYLCDGRYTFVNGEVWSVNSDSKISIDIPSSSKLKIKQASKSEREKREQAEQIEREKLEQVERIEHEKREQAEQIERKKREQLEQLERVERSKREKESQKKLTEFRKKIKPGIQVSFQSSGYKIGMVTSVKGDMVNVQVTKEVPANAMKVYSVRPYDQWVKKSDINYANAWSF